MMKILKNLITSKTGYVRIASRLRSGINLVRIGASDTPLDTAMLAYQIEFLGAK
jgi:hypothetical protein